MLTLPLHKAWNKACAFVRDHERSLGRMLRFWFWLALVFCIDLEQIIWRGAIQTCTLHDPVPHGLGSERPQHA